MKRSLMTVLVIVFFSSLVQFTGSTFNLDTYSPGGATLGPPGGDPQGGVTSVGLSLPSIFTATGSPVTSSGTLTGAFNSESANTVIGNCTTSSGAPTYCGLTTAMMASTFNPTYLSNTLKADQFTAGGSQTAPDQMIQNAWNSASSGMIVDATGITGRQSFVTTSGVTLGTHSGKLILGPGTFNIDSLSIGGCAFTVSTNGVEIEGSGFGVTNFVTTGQQVNKSVICSTGAQHVKVHGITATGGGYVPDSGTPSHLDFGIELYGVNDWDISVEATNWGWAGIALGECGSCGTRGAYHLSSNVDIHDSNIHDNPGEGVQVAGSPGCQMPSVVNTSVSGSTYTVNWVSGDPFLTWPSLAGYAVNINGTSYTVATVTSASSLTLTTSAGNQTGVSLFWPVEPGDTHDTVENNRINNNGLSGLDTGGSNFVTATGNVFTGNGWDTNRSGDESGVQLHNCHITFANNQLANSYGVGIAVDGSYDRIVDNTVSNTVPAGSGGGAGTGIQLGNYHVGNTVGNLIKGNSLTGNASSGVALWMGSGWTWATTPSSGGTGASVNDVLEIGCGAETTVTSVGSGGMVTGVAGNGMAATGYPQTVAPTGCVTGANQAARDLTHASASGIALNLTALGEVNWGNEIADNHILNNLYYGIFVGNTTTNTLLHGNQVLGNTPGQIANNSAPTTVMLCNVTALNSPGCEFDYLGSYSASLTNPTISSPTITSPTISEPQTTGTAPTCTPAASCTVYANSNDNNGFLELTMGGTSTGSFTINFSSPATNDYNCSFTAQPYNQSWTWPFGFEITNGSTSSKTFTWFNGVAFTSGNVVGVSYSCAKW